MPTDIASYKNAGAGKVKHFLEKEQHGPRANVDPDAPGIPGFPGFEPPVVHPNKKSTESGAPFKLRSGNTSSFKMMGSSPAKIFGGIFGGGGGGSWHQRIMDKIKAKREARRNKRLGLTAAAPGGGGGDGAHTHGTGGEPIGAGAQAVTAQAAAPVEPGVEEEEVV